jgi:hypothetical protein
MHEVSIERTLDVCRFTDKIARAAFDECMLSKLRWWSGLLTLGTPRRNLLVGVDRERI